MSLLVFSVSLCTALNQMFGQAAGPISVVARTIQPPSIIWVCGDLGMFHRYLIWDSLHLPKLQQPS